MLDGHTWSEPNLAEIRGWLEGDRVLTEREVLDHLRQGEVLMWQLVHKIEKMQAH